MEIQPSIDTPLQIVYCTYHILSRICLIKRHTLNPDQLDYLALAVSLNVIFVNQVMVLSKSFQY